MARKIMLWAVLILVAIFFSGCGKNQSVRPAPVPSLPEPAPAQTVISPIETQIPPEPVPNPDSGCVSPLIYTVTAAPGRPGWTVFNGQDRYALESAEGGYTPVWEGFVPPISFVVPGTWEFNGSSIFYLQGNKKLEFSAVIRLQPGQDIFARRQDQYSGDEYTLQVLSEEEVDFNGFRAIKRVETGSFFDFDAFYENPDQECLSRVWYLHRYIITDGTYAFLLTFWEPDQMLAENGVIYDQVVHSFRFDHIP